MRRRRGTQQGGIAAACESQTPNGLDGSMVGINGYLPPFGIMCFRFMEKLCLDVGCLGSMGSINGLFHLPGKHGNS